MGLKALLAALLASWVWLSVPVAALIDSGGFAKQTFEFAIEDLQGETTTREPQRGLNRAHSDDDSLL